MKVADEKGIALVLSIFLMTAMSIIAASLMFLSQTETYSSLNYRLMSQARYGAESGVHKAANYILYSYVAPGNTGANAADLIASYDITKSPVLCVAGCTTLNSAIVLSADTVAHPGNYPVAAVQTAFAAAFAGALGTLPAGTTSVSFAPYATLMSMQQIDVYGGGVQTIQTWQVMSTGTITAGRTAQVEVTAIIETPKFPAQMYAAFSTNPGCGSLQFSGSSTTKSYDSSTYSGVGSITAANGGVTTSGGNVGTNGNLGESGNATINGTLSSPRVGIGDCSAGNVDALSSSGHATVTGGVQQLPAAIAMPTPSAPAACASGGPCEGAVSWNGSPIILSGNYNDVTLSTGTVTLCSPGATCTINVNSLKFTGNATINVATGATVILNVSGKDASGAWLANPVDLVGGATTNASMDAAHLQLQYAGTGLIKLGGTDQMTAMVYAPNATATLDGNFDYYGSIVTATLNVTGNPTVYYDRHLTSEFFTVGNAMMSSFSWKKY
jgi:hypothetical protein